MKKKLDIEGCIIGLTAEIVEKVGHSADGTTRIIMQQPRIRCSAVRIERFTELEYMTVQAMLAWAAENTNVPETNVRIRTAAMFDAKCVEDIDRCHYHDIVEYLCDFDATLN